MKLTKVLKHISYLIEKKYNNLFLLIWPNNFRLLYKNINFNKNWPSVSQTLVFRGPGVIEIGNDCSFGYKLGGRNKGGIIEFQCREKQSLIRIGNNVSTNNNIFICALNSIVIDDNTLIGQNVFITDFEAHGIHPSKRNEIGLVGNVNIGKNVWIGSNVTILKNSTIGDNSIISTGSVVSGSFPSNVIIGGVPARIISEINTNE